MTAQTLEFLSFSLGGLEYGLDVRQVRELCLLENLERFADGPTVVPGVARARGVIMPLVDLRAAIAGSPLPQDPHSSVIIVTLADGAHGIIGMVVDHVNGVVALQADQIRKLPCAGDVEPADYLLGLGSIGVRRLILVDIARLMAVGQPSCLV